MHLQLPRPQQRASHQRSASTGSAFQDPDGGDTWPTGAHSRRSLSVAEGNMLPLAHSPERRRQRQHARPAAVAESDAAAPDTSDAAAPQPPAEPAAADSQSGTQLANGEHTPRQPGSPTQGDDSEQLQPAFRVGSPHQRHRERQQQWQNQQSEQRQQQQPPLPQASHPQQTSAVKSPAPHRHLPSDSFTGCAVGHWAQLGLLRSCTDHLCCH